MPMKWTSESDQTLLLMILQTSNITANADAISQGWPVRGESPTARAIRERLVAIRKEAAKRGIGAGGASTFSIATSAASSATSTPRKTPKSTTRKSATVSTPTSKRAKIKTEAQTSDSDREDEFLIPAREVRSLSIGSNFKVGDDPFNTTASAAAFTGSPLRNTRSQSGVLPSSLAAPPLRAAFTGAGVGAGTDASLSAAAAASLQPPRADDQGKNLKHKLNEDVENAWLEDEFMSPGDSDASNYEDFDLIA